MRAACLERFFLAPAMSEAVVFASTLLSIDWFLELITHFEIRLAGWGSLSGISETHSLELRFGR